MLSVFHFSLRKGLIHLSLVKKTFFRLKRTGIHHPHRTTIRPVHAEYPHPARRQPQVKKPRLNPKPRRVRQKPNRKWIFKRFFNFPLIQRTIHFEGRIVPIELHGVGQLSLILRPCNVITMYLHTWVNFVKFLMFTVVLALRLWHPPPHSSIDLWVSRAGEGKSHAPV